MDIEIVRKLKGEFAGVLSCPRCYDLLSLKGNLLSCKRCDKAYPIIRGIPRFVESDFYTRSFSIEWIMHRETQLSKNIGEKYQILDFELRTGFKVSSVPSGLVLDAGCGAGRHSELLARFGWRIVAVDLSLSVETAYNNLRHYDNVLVVQADLNNLPFRNDIFERIFSLGVLHHTPNPKYTFKRLSRHVKTSGLMSVSVYSDEGLLIKIHNRYGEIYRKLASRLDAWALYNVISRTLPKMPLPYHLYKVPIERFVRHKNRPELTPTNILSMFIPFLSFAPNLDWRILDTYDYLSPKFASKHTYNEVVSWFKTAGFVDIKKLPIPVSVTGRKL